MKESGNEKLVMKKNINDVWLFTQFLLTALLLVFVIIWIFVKSNIVEGLVNLTLGLVFMVMGYNNYKVYKRKMFTAMYLVIGVYFLIMSITGIF